eukprot:60088_1
MSETLQTLRRLRRRNRRTEPREFYRQILDTERMQETFEHIFARYIWEVVTASYCTGRCESPAMANTDEQIDMVWMDLVYSRSRLLINIDHELELVVVAFRGAKCSSFTNFLLSGMLHATQDGVHKGFSETVGSFADALDEEMLRIVNEYPNFPIILAGHGQGGALCGIYSIRAGSFLNVLAILTYGSVSFVRHGFPLSAFGVGDRFYRMCSIIDIIPHLMYTGFEHSGKLIEVGVYRERSERGSFWQEMWR